MKKLVTTAACVMAAAAAFGQGTFSFNSNIGATPGVAPDNSIFLSNGTTPADSPYQAEVAIGTGTTLSALTLYPASITAITGGYIFGPTLTITPSTPGSTVAFDILVWNSANGSTFAAASAVTGAVFGSSGVIQGYSLGGPNPTGGPTLIAGNPAFNSFKLGSGTITPEPTTLALGAMGLGAMLLARRRK
jgi:hypothetical protein